MAKYSESSNLPSQENIWTDRDTTDNSMKPNKYKKKQ